MLPVIIVSFFVYFDARRNIETEIFEGIGAVVGLKSASLSAYFQEKEREVRRLCRPCY